MNKHNKQKSREIRAIMRTDRQGRMTYKEARRRWCDGSRVIWFSPSGPWMSFDNGNLSLSNRALKNFAIVYREVLKYANERCMELSYEQELLTGGFKLRLSGRAFNGKRFSGYMFVPICDLEYWCEPKDLAMLLLARFDDSMFKNGFYPPKPLHVPEPIFPLINLHEDPMRLRPIPSLDEWDSIMR